MEHEQRCLLGVFAHPDDEATLAGPMRRYHDQGVRTALICATRGEEGEISDPALATRETLGRVREQELREAARIIPIDDLTFLDYHDGHLADADPGEATGRIVRQIRRLRPQVIVTFDTNGGYGHRDHIAIHHLTLAAFRQAGDARAYPEQRDEGLRPYQPRKLYYVAFPRSLMRRMMERVLAAQPTRQLFGSVATIPPEEMGTEDERITTAIPLDDGLYAVRDAALQAHRTQMNPNGPFANVPPDVMRQIWGTAYFVRAIPAPGPGDALEDDLFAGL
ncbi:MAG TPA: PIG-L family deacetylase [Chloroflexota bacterium]|nr:PIG-L family deacetylase [Chloroflexota bacterium]